MFFFIKICIVYFYWLWNINIIFWMLNKIYLFDILLWFFWFGCKYEYYFLSCVNKEVCNNFNVFVKLSLSGVKDLEIMEYNMIICNVGFCIEKFEEFLKELFFVYFFFVRGIKDGG